MQPFALRPLFMVLSGLHTLVFKGATTMQPMQPLLDTQFALILSFFFAGYETQSS